MNNLFLVLAGVNGFIAVSLGAFAAHGLKSMLGPDLLATFQTGVQYHMYHSLALLAVGILVLQFPAQTGLQLPASSSLPASSFSRGACMSSH